jgi:hypothetical protein
MGEFLKMWQTAVMYFNVVFDLNKKLEKEMEMS